MKTLNDSLREEFATILDHPEILEKIQTSQIDIDVLKRAFEVLLKYKSKSDLADNARSEFENYLINYFKLK